MTSPLRIAITGATGFIGVPLQAALRAEGHEVLLVGRAKDGKAPPDITWDPARGVIDPTRFDDVDAVCHLAGEPIAQRWTDARKTAIRESREKGTKLIAETLASRRNRPRVLVSMSAIGFYGDRGDEVLTEASPSGKGFLADVVRRWEAAAEPARQAGIRVVHPRGGIILHEEGGALGKMLPPFRLGVGGRIGDGRQWMSWISRDDAVRALIACVTNSTLQGPVNVVAPEPVTNATLTNALGKALQRPTALVVPEFAIRVLYGEMGTETVLASQRVHPTALEKAGFTFRHRTLGEGLRSALSS